MIGAVAFAFSAGMVATVNPCGFAMIPAYLALFLTNEDTPQTRSPVVSGLRVGLLVMAAFVATFAVVGALFRLVSSAVVNVMPWAALVVGVLLAIAGLGVLTGKHIAVRSIQLRFKRDNSARSIVLFGVAYAVASVSCTLPIFLAVTSAATTADSVPQGIVVFAAYGLGMGAVLVALAVAVATSRQAIVGQMQRVMPYVERIGGWLLLGSGIFIVYYWTTLLTVDVTGDNPLLVPILWVEGLSSWFTNQIANNTGLWIIGFVLLIGGIASFEVRRKRRQQLATTESVSN
ncbi:MAG: cytochrome c biogenesis protein CcdA [Acidobacteria bacterium]|nr:cytochrome c biogenesis protein CcdA [Acidobacteriota bacterium]